MSLPQHPARQAQQEQQVDPRGSANPYYRSNPALDAAGAEAATMNAQKQVGLEQAQTMQALAQADKLAAENAVLQQAGGLGNPQAEAQRDPVQQLAEGMMSGQVDQATLESLVQSGQVTPEMADAAIQMVQGPTEGTQAQGLGAIV